MSVLKVKTDLSLVLQRVHMLTDNYPLHIKFIGTRLCIRSSLLCEPVQQIMLADNEEFLKYIIHAELLHTSMFNL